MKGVGFRGLGFWVLGLGFIDELQAVASASLSDRGGGDQRGWDLKGQGHPEA